MITDTIPCTVRFRITCKFNNCIIYLRSRHQTSSRGEQSEIPSIAFICIQYSMTLIKSLYLTGFNWCNGAYMWILSTMSNITMADSSFNLTFSFTQIFIGFRDFIQLSFIMILHFMNKDLNYHIVYFNELEQITEFLKNI